jgi:tripartite-type tricarboxylate transporter receptor subunit TctC
MMIARIVLALMGFWAVFAAPASAQSYPDKPIRIVVPFAAGGITDILARAVGQRLGDALGQQVIIDNKPGAGGNSGTDLVAKSAPDGYTLLVTADASFVMNPHLYAKLPYEAANDFIPITGLGISPQALVVNPSVPAKTLKELIEIGKAKPGTLNYGTFGPGTSGHLNIIVMEQTTGAKFTPVHYRGAAPAINDLLGGHIQMMIVSIGLVSQHWQSGKLNVLGFGSAERVPQFPDVPTLAEAGLPGYEAGSWYGLVAPKGTPAPVIQKVSTETQKILADPEFRAKFLTPNFIYAIGSPPAEFAARISRDNAKWEKVIKDAGVKVE